MYRYKVLKTGYIQSILREPDGKHDPILSPVKLPKASWYEEMEPLPDAESQIEAEEEIPERDVEKRQTIIEDELYQLDPDEESHWTKQGIPDLRTLSEKCGFRVSREDLPEYDQEEARRRKKVEGDLGTMTNNPGKDDLKVLS